jgi:DNA-binding FadR family transcriptional regulator
MGSGGMPATRIATRLHETIAQDLGVAILSGRYQPGDLLDGEITASGKLRVSRSAYREAMRMLAAKGLVESRPKTGTRVTPRARWNLLDPDVLAWQFEGEPDESLLRSLFELRMIVEPATAALAAERRTDLQMEQLRAAVADMALFTLQREEGRQADRRFHAVLLDAVDNEHLRALTSTIGASVRWTTVFKLKAGELPRDPVPDHERVYEAVRLKDAAGAHRAMAELIQLAAADVHVDVPLPERIPAQLDWPLSAVAGGRE